VVGQWPVLDLWFQTNSREVEALVGRPSSGSMVFQTNSREVEALPERRLLRDSELFQTNSREVEADARREWWHPVLRFRRTLVRLKLPPHCTAAG